MQLLLPLLLLFSKASHLGVQTRDKEQHPKWLLKYSTELKGKRTLRSSPYTVSTVITKLLSLQGLDSTYSLCFNKI